MLLVLAGGATAQSIPKNERELKQQRERLLAISMIEQTAAEAPQWDEKKNAVQVLTDAADLLWEQKPTQAAKWLMKAWELIAQVSDAPRDERLKDFFTRSDRTRETGAPDLGLSVVPSAGGSVDRPRIGFSFRNAVDPLIATDFEQVAATAERFSAKEVRGLARVEVAKLYLRQPAK